MQKCQYIMYIIYTNLQLCYHIVTPPRILEGRGTTDPAAAALDAHEISMILNTYNVGPPLTLCLLVFLNPG